VPQSINVIDASTAAPLAGLPLLELLSFRVLRTMRPAGYTDALLFAKHATKDVLVAHRVLFQSTQEITAFHGKLKQEFNSVAAQQAATTNGNTTGEH
jgi:hypothetical protein